MFLVSKFVKPEIKLKKQISTNETVKQNIFFISKFMHYYIKSNMQRYQIVSAGKVQLRAIHNTRL